MCDEFQIPPDVIDEITSLKTEADLDAFVTEMLELAGLCPTCEADAHAGPCKEGV